MLVYIPGFSKYSDKNVIGQKAFTLFQLYSEPISIPRWMVVTAQACALHIPSKMQLENPATIQLHIESLTLQKDFVDEISLCAQSYCWNSQTLCALRSCAIGENNTEYSFNGQLKSLLCVPFADIFESIKQVWKSAFTDEAFAYRKENGIIGKPTNVSIIIQEMVDADCSGIVRNINPTTGDRKSITLSAVYGLGEGIKAGIVDADNYIVKYRTLETGKLDLFITETIAEKIKSIVFDKTNGKLTTEQFVIPERQNRPCLSQEQLRDLLTFALHLGNYFKCPQDIQWSFSQRKLFLLNSKPIQGLKKIPDITEPLNIWSNELTIENFSGFTSPLTFSLLQNGYKELYENLFLNIRITTKKTHYNSKLNSLFGYIKGRVYSNILNINTLIDCLPGFRILIPYLYPLEGVSRKHEQPCKKKNKNQSIYKSLKIIGTLRKLYKSLPKRTKKFYLKINQILRPINSKYFETRSLYQLKENYEELEKSLFSLWQIPLLHDFYTRLFHGIFEYMLEHWKLKTHDSILYDLLSDTVVSVGFKQLEQLQSIVDDIRENNTLLSWFLHTPTQTIVEELLISETNDGQMSNKERYELRKKILKYSSEFGDRCIQEKKIETITPRHNPQLIIDILRNHLPSENGTSTTNNGKEKQLDPITQEQILEQISHKLRWHPLRKKLFFFFLTHTRWLITNRINLNFVETKLMDRIREIVFAIGKQFVLEKKLSSYRDIVYLTKDEIFNYIKGTSVTTKLNDYVSIRKTEFQTWRNVSVPNIVKNHGVLYHSYLQKETDMITENKQNTLQGIACCPGILTAPICIAKDPYTTTKIIGRILVITNADPGWITLFPLAKGLLIEQGTLLSQSVLIARELKLPTITSIPNLTKILIEGESVTMDGSTGIVTRFRIDQNPKPPETVSSSLSKV